MDRQNQSRLAEDIADLTYNSGMSFEEGETISAGLGQRVSPTMTLQKAVDLGEYDPSYLAIFPEWNALSRHVQWQMIRQALRNRRKQLMVQWAEVANQPDLSKKPHLAVALKNIQKQLDRLQTDEENLQVEYST